MPTVQGTDSFDHGFDVPADYDSVFGTPTAVTTPLYQDRLNSLEINSPGNEGVRKNITGSPVRGWSAFPLRVPSALPSGDVVTLGLQDAASVPARIIVTSSGIYASLGASFVTATSFSVDTWHWVEMIYDVNDGTGIKKLYWRMDGTDKETVTLSSAASTVSFAQIVSLSGNASLTWYTGGYWVWGSAASSSDWLGEPSAFPGAGLHIQRSG